MSHNIPLVIDIAGGSGSGKTTVAQAILDRVGADRIAYLQHDSYYKDLTGLPLTLRRDVNFDHPNSLETELLIKHVEALRNLQPVEVPIYDFATDSRTSQTFTVAPRSVIIVEGVLVFVEPELRKLFDVKLFVDADADVRFIRRLRRDITERGRSTESVIKQYEATVRPMNLQPLLDKSARDHSHLCPRQILGVRLGLAGMKALDFESLPADKQLLVITETDGCFADGLSAATDCTVGHRTLRVEDYGKTAAVFVDVSTGRAVRVAPMLDIRQRACAYDSDEAHHYLAQMQAYQTMLDDEMFTVTEVRLTASIESIVSRPGMRVNCTMCGEEIMNEREVSKNGMLLCQPCAHGGYYHGGQNSVLPCAVEQKTEP
jgi:uridine kinase